VAFWNRVWLLKVMEFHNIAGNARISSGNKQIGICKRRR
jgi:hypothetical protein